MKKAARCSNCGSEARIARGDYQFNESGLRGVVLRDIELIKCGKCGNVDPVLFRVDELMHLLAERCINSSTRNRTGSTLPHFPHLISSMSRRTTPRRPLSLNW